MIRPDQNVLRALCNLESNADFRVIQEWFLASAGAQDTVLRSASEPSVLFQAQGAIREHLQFCEYAADPREMAGRMAQEKAGVRSLPQSSVPGNRF